MINRKSILLILVAPAILFSCTVKDDFKQISHAEFLKTHTYSIGQSSLNLTDTSRSRPIKTEIWYPTKDTTKPNISAAYPFKLPPTSQNADLISGQFPLILLSHGTGGNRISQMWLACELVGHGYMVVSVDHFGNTHDHKIPENFVRIWDRPLDITFVINHLLSDPKWSEAIDTNKIGMAGFSLGGYTAIALAGGELDYSLLKSFSETEEGKNEFILPELGDVSKLITPAIIDAGNQSFRDLKDERINAFVAMAPAIGQGFKHPNQFNEIDKPILIIGANDDTRTPTLTNARHYHHLIPDSKYHELKGHAGHYVFMNAARNALKKNAPLIFKDDESVNRQTLHQHVSNIVLHFFTSKFQESE